MWQVYICNIHSGEKPHKCVHLAKRFTEWARNLWSHLKIIGTRDCANALNVTNALSKFSRFIFTLEDSLCYETLQVFSMRQVF